MIRALALSLALAATPAAAVNYCGNTAHQNSCGRDNIYPCCPNGSNCTWWAWESVCRNWHVGLVNWGNANTWAGHANVDPNYDLVGPTVGSVATSTLGNFGHVAWVIGVGGGRVTVTEQNCCTNCSASVRTISYPAGKFNSGYVVRHGSQCSCAAGQVETVACGNCGTQSRSCAGCSWGGWSACAGPDPEGGQQVCDSGSKGVCEASRSRCEGGVLACRSLVAPSAETCDGLDNDCNGDTDEGHPPVGSNPPPFAATLTDVSYPRTLKRGERATIWAEFRNDGTAAWSPDNLWLGARAATKSQLYADSWPAWNVAAVLTHPVQPGEVGRLAFEVIAAADASGELSESFQLQQPDGTVVACPQAEVTPAIVVLRDGEVLSTVGGHASVASRLTADGGCSAAPGFAALGALALLRRRRSACKGDGR